MGNKVRIGKDFTIRWTLTTSEGNPYQINKEAAILRVYSPYGAKDAAGFNVAGNVIEWVFKGKEQKHLGDYTIELVENNGKDGMLSVDSVDAFTLVAHTEQESLNAEGAVEVQTIELTSQVALAPVVTQGESYDDTELRNEITRLDTEKASKAELTELSSEIGKKQDALVSGESIKTINGQTLLGKGNIELEGKDDIFVAIFGETKYQEVVEAYNKHQHVMCIYENALHSLFKLSPNSNAVFTGINDLYTYRLICQTDDKWYTTIKEMETVGNKVKTLSSSSTDTQYPSAKAVFMAISRKSEAKEGVVRQQQNWTQAADKGYDYTITDVVRGAIPQANIDLLNSCGVAFNETSGYFEVNGLTDISYEEAMAIYNKTNAFSQGCLSPSGVGLGGVYLETYGVYRTNVPLLPYRYYIITQCSLSYLFWSNRFIEHINFTNITQLYAKDLASAFDGCFRLKEVQGVIELKNSSTSYSSAFLNCYSLESISLQGIKGNLDFKQSARLSNASILFMIEKSLATSAIVITLHADAYERAMANAEIQAALAAHPNVSLAKA